MGRTFVSLSFNQKRSCFKQTNNRINQKSHFNEKINIFKYRKSFLNANKIFETPKIAFEHFFLLLKMFSLIEVIFFVFGPYMGRTFVS